MRPGRNPPRGPADTTDPRRFARALAKIIERGAALVDQLAEQADEPAWDKIARELDRLALRLHDLADGGAPTRETLPIIELPN